MHTCSESGPALFDYIFMKTHVDSHCNQAKLLQRTIRVRACMRACVRACACVSVCVCEVAPGKCSRKCLESVGESFRKHEGSDVAFCLGRKMSK